MRVHLYLLVCAIICAQLKYSSSQVDLFGDCTENADCPDFSTCVTVGVDQFCQCDAGFVAMDLEVFSDSQPVTVCRNLGPCNTFDNIESDCGLNGECVTYTDNNGILRSFCQCSEGFFGLNCNSRTRNPYTNRPTFYTTRRPGNYGSLLPIIGGGALLLLLLAGGGAALASTSG